MNDTEWFAEHATYLQSPEWQVRRQRVLERDRWICQAGLNVCAVAAVQVHHLTYKHWRNEPLFDLISVCVECHDEITQMDREGRPLAARSAQTAVWEREPLGGDSIETPFSQSLKQMLASQ